MIYNMHMSRVFYNLAIFISIFLLPWWVTSVLCLAGIFLFNKFYEFIFAFLIMYAIYGVGLSRVIASTIYWPLILAGKRNTGGINSNSPSSATSNSRSFCRRP